MSNFAHPASFSIFFPTCSIHETDTITIFFREKVICVCMHIHTSVSLLCLLIFNVTETVRVKNISYIQKQPPPGQEAACRVVWSKPFSELRWSTDPITFSLGLLTMNSEKRQWKQRVSGKSLESEKVEEQRTDKGQQTKGEL